MTACAAALLTSITFAACSGSTDEATPTTTVARSVIPEVEAACKAQATAFDQREPFPLEDFDPEHPNPEQLPVVGAFFTSSNHIGDSFIETLVKLSPPTAEKAKLGALISASKAQRQMSRTQEAAAARKDVEAFVATLPKVDALQQDLNAAAKALGATSCVQE